MEHLLQTLTLFLAPSILPPFRLSRFARRSVDPSVSLPYFDEEGELGGTDLYGSVWEEEVDVSAALLLSCGVEECEGGDDVMKVTTEGKYTYVPIITHQEPGVIGGKDVSVAKGFTVPLITKRKGEGS